MTTFLPLLPLEAIIPIFGFMILVCLSFIGSRRGFRVDWMRRLFLVLALLAVGLRPVSQLNYEQHKRLDANVFFIVDLTGSMVAEDWDGSKPRLEGVKVDMRTIMAMTQGSRYSIIGFDSSATQQLPLTTDAEAVDTWISTMSTEPTRYSKGSNIDRPIPLLKSAIASAHEEDPSSKILVYVFTDGENTDGRASNSFVTDKKFISGGAVLGYGTAQGGRMKASGFQEDGKYIRDSDGSDALSRLNSRQLENVSTELGVRYYHRVAPGGDLKDNLNGVKFNEILAPDPTILPIYFEWYWMAAVIASGLIIWEIGVLTYRLPIYTLKSMRKRSTTSQGDPPRGGGA
ncbi:vWA domain-containing protein [Devriesea agamarum]|uniref:vWA domain-containing protein n=1 Tax=Devriesea agamarum TaxID=472569 RepID=UPI000A062530|nr:VWA domain-containing protein [Devriesea agamarum]